MVARDTWLHQWLDDENLHDEGAVVAAIAKPASFRRLVEAAERSEAQAVEQLPTSRNSVLAGRSLDLTTFLTCPHPDCRVRQVNDLFQHVWHYFDQIAVVGPDAHLLLEKLETDGRLSHYQEFVAGHAKVLFHIRDRGLEDLVLFCRKPPACPRHFRQLRDEPSLHLTEESATRLIDMLMAGGQLGRAEFGKEVVLVHPLLSNGSYAVRPENVPAPEFPGEPLKRRVAREVLRHHWLGAASDIFESQVLGLPLGASIPYEMRVIHELAPNVTPADVAFQLTLPVLKGLQPNELLAIRSHEGESFEAFRNALRTAARERIASSPSADPAMIAREIEEDVILPSLEEIRRKLATAERVLLKKHLVSLGLGGFATTCGMIGAAPLASALAVGSAAGMVAAQTKVLEERRDVSLSDMYFLWKTQEHVRNRVGSKKKRTRKKNK